MPIKLGYEEGSVPKSLLCLCYKYIVYHLETICSEVPEGYTLHKKLTLPGQICDALIESYQNNGFEFNDRFAHLFKDTSRTKLRSVHIRDSKLVTIDGLEYLLRHELYEFKVTNCKNIKPNVYKNVFDHATNLRSMIFRPPPKTEEFYYSNFISIFGKLTDINTLKLKQFVIPSMIDYKTEMVIEMFNYFSHLQFLDYSFAISNLSFLYKLKSLHTLILFNVLTLQEDDAIQNICSVKSLVVLDISRSYKYLSEDYYHYKNNTLAHIVNSLPNLMSLDISGTNLDGEEREEQYMYKSLSGRKSDILGLEHRVDNPLEFLGLFLTMHNACQRHNIPAKRIGGHANEEQLLNCISSNMEKTDILESSLSNLQYLGFEGQFIAQIDHGPDIILKALNTHVKNTRVQLSGSEIIYNILKNKNLPIFNDNTRKRHIITTLLNGIEHQNYDGKVALNVFQVIGILEQDMMFEFKRLVEMLLHFLSSQKFRDSVGLLGVKYVFSVLNSVASQANNSQKNKLGEAGAMKIMIAVIYDILYRNQCNFVIEVTWSIMRNMTDNAPNNSERFLNEYGLQYFSLCWKKILHENGLRLEMLRLIANIAEVKKLRPRLMELKYIDNISSLFSIENGFEISYYAVRFIVYLASDGYEAWNIKNLSRHDILDCLTTAILDWDLDSDLDIIHHSFESILQLAQVRHTPQCIHYATWSLANLTVKYPEKYCSMVIAEGGLRIMSQLLEDQSIINITNQCKAIHGLAQTIINQCLLYEQNINKKLTE